MITGKYDRQLDRSNGSKNVRDLALLERENGKLKSTAMKNVEHGANCILLSTLIHMKSSVPKLAWLMSVIVKCFRRCLILYEEK